MLLIMPEKGDDLCRMPVLLVKPRINDASSASGLHVQCARPASEAASWDAHKGVVWFEVNLSEASSDRQADLAGLVGTIGNKTADGKAWRPAGR